MRIGSLFSGIGGLDLGVERATGGGLIWQAESDAYARAVLAKHWPAVKRYNDVREIDEHAERPDIICGGFPCQDVSGAGRRIGLAGERSGLWSEFARIIGTLRPSVVFIENVPGLLARGLRTVLADLAGLGFDAEWGLVSACAVGSPHTRERVFILAYANGIAGAERIWARENDARALPEGSDRTVSPHHWLESDAPTKRMANGLPRELDRLRALGNAVVPQQAALAWQALSARIGEVARAKTVIR